MFDAVNKGAHIPQRMLGELSDRSALLSNPESLRAVIDRDGFALLRGVLAVDDVLAARREITAQLAEMGELKDPPIDAIVTGTSQRTSKVGDLGAFWKSVSEGKALRAVTHGKPLQRIMASILRGPVIGHDLIYLRVAAPGRALDLHYDYPFFARGTKEVFTVWIPLGEVPVTDGPLYVVEGSNRFHDLIKEVEAIDQSRPPDRKLAYGQSAIHFAESRKARILTANYHAGDVMVFNLFTAHGSLDNCSPIGRARVSCDLRYQRSDAPQDDRYFGPNPTGVTGNGYADLNGAKPLTAEWQTR